ncbi:MAG TPA: hypothetical protein VJ810_15695 [Blastocatellia bacterium]|nr:hypothetical protein [Blastocatellia bacterium]
MTRILRINADPSWCLSAMIRARPRHLRSIDAPIAAGVNALALYLRMKTDLSMHFPTSR